MTASNPKVSVLMAAYQAEDYLAEAIESVLAQDHRNLELLVSDDGSTDRTGEIAERYGTDDDRVVALRGEHNQGKAVAANRALEVATGDIYAWLDADDVMLPGKLSTGVELLVGAPDAAGCCHDAEVFDGDTGEVLGLFSRLANGRPLREGGVELWFDPTYMHLPSATMFRREACPPHGLDPRLRRAHDWLFDIEVFRHGRCVVTQRPLVRYRRHAGQLSDEASRQAWLEESLMVMALVEARYPELHRLLTTSRTALLLGESRRRAQAGERREAARWAADALRAGGPTGIARVATHMARASRGRRGAPGW